MPKDSLSYRATSADIDPDVRLLAFSRDEDDVGLTLAGGEDPVPLEHVQLWYGPDDGKRADHAIESAELDGAVLTLHLTAKGAALCEGAKTVHVSIDLPDLQIELRSVRAVLELLFERAPDKLVIAGAPVSKRPKAKADAPAARAKSDPAAVGLVKLLVERKLIELEEGAAPEALAARIAPLLKLIPEKRAKKEVVALLFDEPLVAEVFADEDFLYAIVREFVG